MAWLDQSELNAIRALHKASVDALGRISNLQQDEQAQPFVVGYSLDRSADALRKAIAGAESAVSI